MRNSSRLTGTKLKLLRGLSVCIPSLHNLVCSATQHSTHEFSSPHRLGTTTNYYNLQGLLTQAQNAQGTVRSSLYDILDRPTAVIAPSGITNFLSYDLIGRVITNVGSTNLTNSFVYSANGLTRAVDGLGKTSWFANDAAGRILFCTNANSELILYKYDCTGVLTNLVDGNSHATSFRYDQFGRLTNKLDNTFASILQLT